MHRELNKCSLHSRDGIKLNGRLGKGKSGVGENDREKLLGDTGGSLQLDQAPMSGNFWFIIYMVALWLSELVHTFFARITIIARA